MNFNLYATALHYLQKTVRMSYVCVESHFIIFLFYLMFGADLASFTHNRIELSTCKQMLWLCITKTGFFYFINITKTGFLQNWNGWCSRYIKCHI